MKKKDRPKLTIERQPIDRWVDLTSLLLLILILAIPSYYYQSLPDRIPTHFNGRGEADGFGPKYMIWVLPIISLCMYAMLTFLQRIPHTFNYLQEITMDNAEKQYRGGISLMRFMKLWILGLFLYLVYASIQNALGNQEGIGRYFIVIVLVVSIGIPLVLMMFSNKDDSN